MKTALYSLPNPFPQLAPSHRSDISSNAIPYRDLLDHPIKGSYLIPVTQLVTPIQVTCVFIYSMGIITKCNYLFK